MALNKYLKDSLISGFAFLFVCVALFFKTAAIMKDVHHHNLAALLTIPYFLILAILFMVRKPAQQESNRWLHWFIAVAANALPFLQTPVLKAIDVLVWVSLPIQLVGIVFTVVTLLALGKGFGVIAARRTIKTHGPYRFIRHPLYAFEILSGIAFNLQNPSWWNLIIFLVVILCQVLRMNEEEAVLSHGDETYPMYCQQVRYRLIPGLY